MKLNIQKLQQGNTFWGLKSGNYTPEYTKLVNDILSDKNRMNQTLQDLKIQGVTYVKTPQDFQKFALDKQVGKVHNYIKSLLPQDSLVNKITPDVTKPQPIKPISLINESDLPREDQQFNFKPGASNDEVNRQIYNASKHGFARHYFENVPFEQVPQEFFDSVKKSSNQIKYRTGKLVNGQAQEEKGDSLINVSWNPSHFKNAMAIINSRK